MLKEELKKIETIEVTVTEVKNQKATESYGVILKEGQVTYLSLIGNIEFYKDRYKTFDIEGNELSFNIPSGKARDIEGNEYYLEVVSPGFVGLFTWSFK